MVSETSDNNAFDYFLNERQIRAWSTGCRNVRLQKRFSALEVHGFALVVLEIHRSRWTDSTDDRWLARCKLLRRFSSHVGIGSSERDLAGIVLSSLVISPTVAGSKVDSGGACRWAISKYVSK